MLNNAKINVRQEVPSDFDAVFKLISRAFNKVVFSNHDEQLLVQRLRKSKGFIPELSLVAEFKKEILGFILLTKIKIINNLHVHESLALAPMAVLPEFQKQGIGKIVIEKAHNMAKTLGFKSIIVLGHPEYYPKFGYKKASEFGIKLPFDVPDENCMALELIKNGLIETKGIVHYPKEFNE